MLRVDNSVSPEHYLSCYFAKTNLTDTVHYWPFVNSWSVIFLLLFLHPALCSATLIQRLLIIHCKRMCITKSFPFYIERNLTWNIVLKYCYSAKTKTSGCFNIILMQNLNHSTVPAIEKEINCIPDKIRTAL